MFIFFAKTASASDNELPDTDAGKGKVQFDFINIYILSRSDIYLF